MFENTSSPLSAEIRRLAAADLPVPAGASGGELRRVAWSELTARLNAARDLRLMLRSDSRRAGDHRADFADAAARYFRGKEERDFDGKQTVNRIVLEPGKGSPAMVTGQHEGDPNSPSVRNHATAGDAREN